MRVAYVTPYDAHDPRQWSGLGYHIARSLEQTGCELEYIGPLRQRMGLYFKAKTLLYRKLRHQAFQREREPIILDGYAAQIQQSLRSSNAQVVFSPGTLPIAHLTCKQPIVFWSDATYAVIQDAYRWELPACAESRRKGNAMEQTSLDRAAMAIFACEWAAESAIRDYHADPAKVKVVPFGANIEESRSADEVRAMIAARSRDVCRLLFVGVGWERKGGDLAIEATRALNELGVKAELTILGSLPPDMSSLPPFVKPLGFIDKTRPEGRARFESIFAQSHFFILPARAEAFGVVLCEANSFGLPCLATRVGGIPTIIRDGVNGHLFAPEDPQAMARGAAEVFSDAARYAQLAQSAFAEYEARLNWRVAGQTVKRLLESL